MSVAIIILMIASIVITFVRRNKVLNSAEIIREEIPEKLLSMVEYHERDGYQIISIQQNSVNLIKKKRHLYPWLFLLPVPSGIIGMLNTSFFCNLYGLTLTINGDEVRVSTY